MQWKRDGWCSRERRKRSTWRGKLSFDLELDLEEKTGRREGRRRGRKQEEEGRKRKKEDEEEGGRDVNGSSPWDVRGSRVPWRAAGRVHGVFRVVLRYTVVRGGTTYARRRCG